MNLPRTDFYLCKCLIDEKVHAVSFESKERNGYKLRICGTLVYCMPAGRDDGSGVHVPPGLAGTGAIFYDKA